MRFITKFPLKNDKLNRPARFSPPLKGKYKFYLHKITIKYFGSKWGVFPVFFKFVVVTSKKRLVSQAFSACREN
ncbi:hypothetical protein ABEV77_22410, partial [Bacillus subtilis]